ncbi:ABC transporter permease [Phenylobacterium sp.]|uniref:ABC transporter permease n=1 Tax=Phenylobacterium sp. TaxID=1871053 RepID=UPI00286CCEA4|nr:ABC transporter permease [Phenylobacterium sp.]
MSLALATLLYEWRRYTAAVVALAFSGLLILAQVGMFTGIVRAITASIDRSRADLMILAPKNESLINSGPDGLPERIQPLIYLNPQVVEVESLDGDGARWVNTPAPGKKTVTTFVNTFDVDPRPGAVTLPLDYPESVRLALLEPYAVVIDKSAQKTLGTHLGATATLNGKTVHVRALLETYPNVNQPTVYMSRDTMRLLGMGPKNGKTGPLMVRLRDPSQVQQVVDQLNATSKGAYKAWTKGDLAKANETALMSEQIIGIFLSFSVFLGFLIGVGITSQTLRGAILASIKEFASLRALGVSMGSLRWIILELSVWVGLAGLIATAVFTWLVYLLGQSGGLPMGFPAAWVIGVATLLVVISIASGLLSLGILKKSQPADLLR